MIKKRIDVVKEEMLLNVSTTFLLYNIGLNYSFLLNRGLVNAYIGNVDEYTGSIDEVLERKYELHLLFNSGSDVKDLYNNPNYLGEYDLENHFCLVFKYPDKYKLFYDNVINSKYSKIPIELTDIVKVGTTHADRQYFRPTVYQVIVKDKDLLAIIKDLYAGDLDVREYWKEFDWNKEVLNYENLK